MPKNRARDPALLYTDRMAEISCSQRPHNETKPNKSRHTYIIARRQNERRYGLHMTWFIVWPKREESTHITHHHHQLRDTLDRYLRSVNKRSNRLWSPHNEIVTQTSCGTLCRGMCAAVGRSSVGWSIARLEYLVCHLKCGAFIASFVGPILCLRVVRADTRRAKESAARSAIARQRASIAPQRH